MTEFWETAFKDRQEMWGFQPAHAALLTRDYFVENGVKTLLIPGIGYGRNAQVFTAMGINVTGIEISKTAIALAEKHFGTALTIHHGSVTDMPFDTFRYDGIFCHALIHLLDGSERAKFIADCYDQLAENGHMVFTAITKNAPTYGQGTPIGQDRFEMFGGLKIFFYDQKSIRDEFGKFGLLEVLEVQENHPFYMIRCTKQSKTP